MSERAVKVYDLAHCRAGDKGNTSNISVIAYEDRFYPFLREHLPSVSPILTVGCAPRSRSSGCRAGRPIQVSRSR